MEVLTGAGILSEMSLDGGRIVVSASGKVGTQPELLVDAIKEADPMSKAAKQQAAGTVRRQLCAALSLSRARGPPARCGFCSKFLQCSPCLKNS